MGMECTTNEHATSSGVSFFCFYSRFPLLVGSTGCVSLTRGVWWRGIRVEVDGRRGEERDARAQLDLTP